MNKNFKSHKNTNRKHVSPTFLVSPDKVKIKVAAVNSTVTQHQLDIFNLAA